MLLWYSAWDDAGARDRFAEALGRMAARLPQRQLFTRSGELDGRPVLRVLVGRAGPMPGAVPPACLVSTGSCVTL